MPRSELIYSVTVRGTPRARTRPRKLHFSAMLLILLLFLFSTCNKSLCGCNSHTCCTSLFKRGIEIVFFVLRFWTCCFYNKFLFIHIRLSERNNAGAVVTIFAIYSKIYEDNYAIEQRGFVCHGWQSIRRKESPNVNHQTETKTCGPIILLLLLLYPRFIRYSSFFSLLSCALLPHPTTTTTVKVENANI